MGSGAALLRVLRLGPRDWGALPVAAWELARARRRLGRHRAQALIELSRRQGRPSRPTPPGAGALVDRVAFAIPRVAARLPWRADCWVQALAAQAWLARHGVPSEIWIGVRQDRAPEFEAHAWLLQQGRTVTGGDLTGFVPLVTPLTDL